MQALGDRIEVASTTRMDPSGYGFESASWHLGHGKRDDPKGVGRHARPRTLQMHKINISLMRCFPAILFIFRIPTISCPIVGAFAVKN